MRIDAKIRQLARSTYWQNLYGAAQKINIQLFENNTNFSGIQSLFLYWLNTYSCLYEELAKKENKYLSNDVIEDDVRCDAFLYYRQKTYERELREYLKNKKLSEANLKSKEGGFTFDLA